MRIQRLNTLAALGITVITLFSGCASAPPGIVQSVPTAPEVASGYQEKSGWLAKKMLVAAANPLAAEAGLQILRAGGSAIDAAIATQMVLGLVEPQSSGIGGGAFLLHFDGEKIDAFDGRETAPASATEHLFQDANGKPLAFYDGVVGGRAVGVPGVVKMLALAHRQGGRLPWAQLFTPAIELAERGFAISPRLVTLIAADRFLAHDPIAAAYFYDGNGKPWPAGHLLKNPRLAQTLRAIARDGADAFYRGPIAQAIVDKVNHHPTNPGGLSRADLAAYQPKVRSAICSDYRVWTVCGMPPPSSGAIAIAQILGILETRDLAALAPRNGELDPQAVHLFSEAGRLAYADRNRYVADPDFVPLPSAGVEAMLNKAYLRQRAALIGERSLGTATPGQPPGLSIAWGDDNALERPSTSHISIIDAAGHAVSMTTTIEDAFGSRQMVEGFLLNNQLTDFSFDAADANGPIANRVQPGKRPRSSMAPTFVFDKGTHNLVLATGSPGGSAIINYVAKVLVGVMDWRLNVQQAISLPNFGSRNGPTELEQGRASIGLMQALQARGHNLRVIEQTSGLQGIMRIKIHGEDWWFGGADPRREGVVMGK